MPFMQIPNTFSVFPVKDKKPLIKWEEFQHRLPTKKEREKWKGQQLGIVTGSISNILVLDDDGGLDLEKYPIPKTWTQKTPRGGTHYFFKWQDSLKDRTTTRTEILPKVDVRGSGGFVVFYGWEKPTYLQHLQSPPQWLIDLLPNKNENKQVLGNEDWLQKALKEMKIGNIDDTLVRILGKMRGSGWSAEDAFLCLQPLALERGATENHVREKIENVWGRYQPNVSIDTTQASSIEDFLQDEQKVEWICEGMIAKKSIGFVVGLPETKKTFIAMDLAIEAAINEG